METRNELAAKLSHELKSAQKAEQFRFWAKQAITDCLNQKQDLLPKGVKAADFANGLTIDEVKFDEDQVDKADPLVVLSYHGGGVKYVIANLVILFVEEGWSKDILNFWNYALGSPRFRVVSVLIRN